MRFAHFIRRQLNDPAVAPNIDRHSQTSVFINRFRHGYLESDFRTLVKRQPQYSF